MRKFFVDNYLKCWKFAKKCRWFFVFASGLFALTFLIGFSFPVFFRTEIFDFIRTLTMKLEGKGIWELIVFIFLNNLQASFFAMTLGILFGIFPMMTCIANGYLLGFVAREAVVVDGFFSLWRIFPHGIFELPAVIFSIGIGMKIGVNLFGKDAKKKLRYNFREGLRFFAFVILPLLVVAGIIEGVLVGFM